MLISRILGFLFGVAGYAVAVGALVYLVAFIGNVPVPELGIERTIDTGGWGVSGTTALLVDLMLLLAFGLQHSVMARPGFKSAVTRVVPSELERSLYCIATGVAVVLLGVFWQPLPKEIWNLSGGLMGNVLLATYLLGFAIVLTSSFLIDHFELFGIRQALAYLTGGAPPSSKFVTPVLYKFVRHPIYVGFLVALWSAPVMTQGRLLLAGVWTAYMLVAIPLEERDLVQSLPDYDEYRSRVPALIPALRRGREQQGR